MKHWKALSQIKDAHPMLAPASKLEPGELPSSCAELPAYEGIRWSHPETYEHLKRRHLYKNPNVCFDEAAHKARLTALRFEGKPSVDEQLAALHEETARQDALRAKRESEAALPKVYRGHGDSESAVLGSGTRYLIADFERHRQSRRREAGRGAADDRRERKRRLKSASEPELPFYPVAISKHGYVRNPFGCKYQFSSMGMLR